MHFNMVTRFQLIEEVLLVSEYLVLKISKSKDFGVVAFAEKHLV